MKSNALRCMVLLPVVAGLFGMPAQAREMYGRVAMGAAGSWAGDSVTVNSTYADLVQTVEKEELSFGRGVGLDAAIGTDLADGLRAEVAMGYLYGLEFESRRALSSTSNFGSTSTDRFSGRMFRVVPSLAITTKVGNLKPFARVGAVIAMPTVLESEDSITDGKHTIQVAEFTGGLALGLAAAAGLEIPITSTMAIAAELNYLSMSFKPTNARLTVATVDGVDKLSTMTTREKEIEFSDSVVTTGSDSAIEGAPRKAASQSLPFSNFGFGLALVFKF